MVSIQNESKRLDSTEEHLLIASAIPDSKRRRIIESALAQADLNDDVVFVGAYEALSGFCTVVGGDN